MRASDVEVMRIYEARVSGRLAPVRLLGPHPYGGWAGLNLRTGRAVRMYSLARLRGPWREPAEPRP